MTISRFLLFARERVCVQSMLPNREMGTDHTPWRAGAQDTIGRVPNWIVAGLFVVMLLVLQLLPNLQLRWIVNI